MRIILIAVVSVLAASQAQASPSCMTLPEARAKFGGAHLWWHGPNHCWDATPSRRRLAQRIKQSEPKELERAGVDDSKPDEAKPVDAKPIEANKPKRWSHDTRWREAMSRMLPDDVVPSPSAQPPARASAAMETAAPSPGRPDWRERWVELAPSAPPDQRKPARVSPGDLAADADEAPIVTPARVMLALLAVVLMLGFVELLFRSTIPEWRQRRGGRR